MCILNEEDVHFELIGGLAAALHGSSLPTQDVDILPLRDSDNLERLSGALARMGAEIRTSNDPVAAPIDGAFLDAMPLMLNLVTDDGDLEIAFDPAGPEKWIQRVGRRRHSTGCRQQPHRSGRRGLMSIELTL